MKEIKGCVSTFLEGKPKISTARVRDIREDNGYLVNSYSELVERIAELSFKNPEFVLFFRGQKGDYRDDFNRTTLYPTIFRGDNYNYWDVFRNRFQQLKEAEKLLVRFYQNPLEGVKELRTYEILRWAVIQHYDVCFTPLLDITHSLRVACSFAHCENNNDEVFLYVLGMPQISGSVTASSEQGLQIIRLLSICPPNAKRPHYQEGFLVGEFPTIGYLEKAEYSREEMDFGRRLICKFRLSKNELFWSSEFPAIPDHYLYPNDGDELLIIANQIKNQLQPQI